MAEWIYEAGIGEARAALISDGRIIEAMIEPDCDAPRVGSVVEARLSAIIGAIGLATLPGGAELLIDPLPRTLTQGAAIRVEVTRAAIPEPGKVKRAKGRISDEPVRHGPDLRARIGACAVIDPFGPDLLEQAGWSEVLETAASGEIAFEGGALRISLTPAMTLIDVDGLLGTDALAIAGAAAAAAAIRRFGIGGSIGIDLPSTTKPARLATAAAIDAALPHPFERTAVNGFGFVQIIRPRPRASLCEHLRFDAAGSAARALLRRAERSGVIGATLIAAHPSVAALISAHPGWLNALGTRLGGAVSLRSDPALAMNSGHVTKA